MADTLSIPFVRRIFNEISGKTSFRNINNYLKSVEHYGSLNPKRIEEFPFIKSHFNYFPCSGMIIPIGTDEGIILGLEKRGEGPIYGDFSYKLENRIHYKHIVPILLEKNYEVFEYFKQRSRRILGPFNESITPLEFICMSEGRYLQEEVRLAEDYISKLQKSQKKIEERTPLFQLCKQAFNDLFIINTTSDESVDVDPEYKRFLNEIEQDPGRDILIQELHIQ